MRKHQPVKRKEFLATCVSAGMQNVDALIEMIERARPITNGTFRRHLAPSEYQRIAQGLGYGQRPRDLKLHRDYHVGFYRSSYHSKPCVFLKHSAIEHIFVAPEDAQEICYEPRSPD